MPIVKIRLALMNVNVKRDIMVIIIHGVLCRDVLLELGVQENGVNQSQNMVTVKQTNVLTLNAPMVSKKYSTEVVSQQEICLIIQNVVSSMTVKELDIHSVALKSKGPLTSQKLDGTRDPFKTLMSVKLEHQLSLTTRTVHAPLHDVVI